MNPGHFKQAYQNLIFLVFAGILSLAANSPVEKVMGEKRTEVAMRMIGHEVLKCLGDSESRVMPIERIKGQYKISFEFEFGFDPEDIVAIVDRVMKETRIATHYLVEVERSDTKEVVHSFEMGNTAVIPCKGRLLPEDRYSLLITILEGIATTVNPASSTSDRSALSASEATEANPLESAFFIIPLLIVVGLIGYFSRKKNPADPDPDLIRIGASRFDKRNMALSFQNKNVELSNKEAELLATLHASANEPVEREVLLQKVWGDEGDYVGRTLDVFISKLRKKLEADTSVKIVNIRGYGYKLVMGVPT